METKVNMRMQCIQKKLNWKEHLQQLNHWIQHQILLQNSKTSSYIVL